MLSFDDDIKTIFIMLGNKCNMNCKYCLQHYSYEKPIDVQRCNPDVIKFIRQVQKKQGSQIDVRFYGGEPLVYWKNIKEIINKLKNSGVCFSIISNGKFITKEITDFLNSHDVDVAVSYDGYGVLKTRRYDVFKKNMGAILPLKKLCVNSVLSPYCLPYSYINSLIGINRSYFDVNGYGIGVTQELIFDIAAVFTDLVDFDYAALKKECRLLSNKAKEIMKKTNTKEKISIDEQLILRYVYFLLAPFAYNGEFLGGAACGNGTSVINIDMEGNLYRCHNDNIKLATIYNTLEEYKKVSSANDNIIKNFLDTDCIDCDIIDYCRGGCPLVSKESRTKSEYCKLRKILFGEYKKMANTLLELKPQA